MDKEVVQILDGIAKSNVEECEKFSVYSILQRAADPPKFDLNAIDGALACERRSKIKKTGIQIFGLSCQGPWFDLVS